MAYLSDDELLDTEGGFTFIHDRMSDVPGDELYRHLSLHASRQPDHRPVAAEDRPELPHGAVLADLFRRPRSAECLWVCCRPCPTVAPYSLPSTDRA